MKIIEAMKRVKMNKEKIADLQSKIKETSANLSHETPLYGADTREKIKGWLQSCEDTGRENLNLLLAIQRTNLLTEVTITLGETNVTRSIAEWIWRRREYAAIDLSTWSQLTDRGLREGVMQSSVPGAPGIEVKIVRHYDPIERDRRLALYRGEKHLIDSALEVVNATTDLVPQ